MEELDFGFWLICEYMLVVIRIIGMYVVFVVLGLGIIKFYIFFFYFKINIYCIKFDERKNFGEKKDRKFGLIDFNVCLRIV